MDVTALLSLVEKAPLFIADYEDKMDLLTAQIEVKKEKDAAGEKSGILDTWISNATKWLLDNEEMYNRCMTIKQLSSKTLEEIKQIYEEIHGIDT